MSIPVPHYVWFDCELREPMALPVRDASDRFKEFLASQAFLVVEAKSLKEAFSRFNQFYNRGTIP